MVFTITQNVNNGVTAEKRCYWKEIFISILASLPFFTHGLETKELSSSAHSGHFKDRSEADDDLRMTVMTVSAALSAPVYCWMIDKHGRKCGVYFVSLLQGASCVPLFLPPTYVNFLVLHVFAGLASAGLFTVFPAYIVEINTIGNRALMISVISVMTTGGYLIGLMLEDEVLMFLMVALIAVQLLGLVCLVESPSYSVMVGKIEKAKSNMANLKCEPEESTTVSTQIESLVQERDRGRSNGKLSLFRILKSPLYRDIIKVGVALYMVLILCGNITFLNQSKVLVQLKIKDDSGQSLVTTSLFMGSLFTFSVIRFLERKHILTFGFTAITLSMGVLAVFNQRDLTVSSTRWLPVAALAVTVFAYGMIWGLPYVVMAEMLNLEIRATVLGMLYAMSQLVKLAHLHSYPHIENYMGREAVIYIFCAINIYGAVYSLFAIPDLKNKSVKQIEKQMKRIPLITFRKTVVKT